MIPVRPWLVIGRYRDTQNPNWLQSRQISAMLQLAAPVSQPGIVSRYLAVEDGEPLAHDLLREGVAFVREQRAAGKNILVACGAGISRSATYVVAALKEEEGLSLVEGLRDLRAVHPAALPHMALWESLCDYYDEPFDYWDII